MGIILEEWFSNFSRVRIPGGWVGPIGLGWGTRIWFLTRSQEVLMLLAQGPRLRTTVLKARCKIYYQKLRMPFLQLAKMGECHND